MSRKNFKSHHEMRQKTYLKIIRALKAGVNSKRGIQDHSGLSWGSCSPVINHLLAQEIIVTQELNREGKPNKGRKTKFFHFNKEKFLLMGMEISRTSISCCVTTLGGELLGSYTTSFNKAINSGNISRKVIDAYLECGAKLPLDPKSVICISFSLTGAIDVQNKIWLYSARIPNIDGIDFNKLDSNGFLPENIYIQHDVHAQAYSVIPASELGDKDYVFLNVGQGIGMSVNMGGILYGHRGFAGEIGHLPYPNLEEELICSCGNKNCFETVLNSDRILNYINNKFKINAPALNEITDETIIQAVVNEYILPTLVFMSTIVSNIFDPRRIIIGGSVLEPFYNLLINSFEKQLGQVALYNGPAQISWYKSSDMDGSYGAILHSGERIVEDFINEIDLDH